MFLQNVAALISLFNCAAALSSNAPPTTGPGIDRPAWTGGGWLSAATNAVIATKPLYNLLKIGARNVLIDSAESKGVGWRAESARLLRRQQELEERKQRLEDPTLTYPEYYLRPFHAYAEGNLNWLAASECESATYSMANRVWPKEGLTSEAAQERLREVANEATIEYLEANGVASPRRILEAGCSVGISTSYLVDAFPEAEVTALDLSPHFLAVAQLREEERRAGEAATATAAAEPNPSGIFQEAWRAAKAATRRPVQWMHANMESTGLPSEQFDVVVFPFLIHELPARATRNCLREAHRLLRRGGVISITEMDPASKIIQNLPPPIFTMMKSTEPHADEYYTIRTVEELAAAGFSRPTKEETADPRHSTWLAIK